MPDKQFAPRPVTDFLTEKDEGEGYRFDIPSFQRGYRWTTKQVEDLLKDLYDFTDPQNKQPVYYLQPLVVRKPDIQISERGPWEVLDGQQRLTTLRLVMNALKGSAPGDADMLDIYEINYLNRPNFDFTKAKPTDNLDSFYVANAAKVIDEWLKGIDRPRKGAMASMLYGFSAEKSVKFIWYEVEGKDADEAGSIAIFNRLNRGKLKLTPSELIKALLIISADQVKKGNEDFKTVLTMQWNEMERQFLKDDFFSFINAGNAYFDTRTDLLFNYLAMANGENPADDDFAYRWLQRVYDEDGPQALLNLWEKDVKDAYDMLLQWYADPEMYNYIGLLSLYNERILAISTKLAVAKRKSKEAGKEWHKEDNLEVLKGLVREKFTPIIDGETKTAFPEAIDLLDYDHHESHIRRLLLLFNIVTYSRKGLRFPFEKYLDEKWDIEHVDSQTQNPLKKNADQRNWLKYAAEILHDRAKEDGRAAELHNEARNLLNNGSQKWFADFSNTYDKIMAFLASGDSVTDKDSISNLTLLDAGTNRGYGNALFPYKRKCIAARDNNGEFVPECTKNLFLKHYTTKAGEGSASSRLKWTADDAVAYLDAIHSMLDPILSEPTPDKEEQKEPTID